MGVFITLQRGASLHIMGVQGPPNVLAFILLISVTVLSIIVLGISGYINSAGACVFGGLVCGGSALGIIAGVFGMLLGILGILWLIIEELWGVGVLKFVVTFGMFGVALFGAISGILYAIAFICCEVAAGAAFGLILALVAVGAGIFAFMAGNE